LTYKEIYKVQGCIFCEMKEDNYIIENEYAFAVMDKFPVSEGHTLVIPKRHFSDFFEITKIELEAVYDLLNTRKNQLISQDGNIGGFNIGVNIGKIAGQSVFHCHIHLMPRRAGDTPNPKGGIRGAIPDKMNYVKGL
jgi:ATP adenylyltransferase